MIADKINHKATTTTKKILCKLDNLISKQNILLEANEILISLFETRQSKTVEQHKKKKRLSALKDAKDLWFQQAFLQKTKWITDAQIRKSLTPDMKPN